MELYWKDHWEAIMLGILIAGLVYFGASFYFWRCSPPLRTAFIERDYSTQIEKDLRKANRDIVENWKRNKYYQKDNPF